MTANNNFLNKELSVVNIGLELFSKTLSKQRVPNIHVAWRPPAGGDKEVALLLEKFEDKINDANAKVFCHL